MFKVRNIVNKISNLFIDIILFTFKVIKQIILPTNKRKGNILSSFFILFIGTIEMVIPFEYGDFKMREVFKFKYCRQGLIIIGALLFLLSSFEWVNNQSGFDKPVTYTAHSSQAFEKRLKISVRKRRFIYLKEVSLNKQYPGYYCLFSNSVNFQSSTSVFLLTKSLRI